MKKVLALTKRNLLIFFRNKMGVFFSFLSVIIIIGLYILFISDLQVAGLKDSLGDVPGIAPLVNSWVMAGLIAVSTVTLSLGSLEIIVADRENNAINDFLVAPINRNQVFISYVLSSLIITALLSITIIIIAELYIISSGGVVLSFIQMLGVLGITIMCVLSSSLLMLFVISFLKNLQAFSILSTIVGTMIGFLTGAYMPIGLMPNSIQVIANLLPASQGAALLRKIFLEKPISEVFAHAPSKVVSDYIKLQGVDLYFGSFKLSALFMIIFIILSIVVFSIMNIIRFKKMKNK
jgi:multidrug/hemolysin transport system permease protein